MMVSVTCLLLRQRFTSGSGPICTLFPYVLIELIVLSRRRRKRKEEEEEEEDVKKFGWNYIR